MMPGKVGKHVLLEIWSRYTGLLSCVEFLEMLLKTAAEKAGATVLNTQFHHFGEGYGVTGVVILAESHTSIHTWPEYEFAAIDVFMCGDCEPMISVEFIQKVLNPHKIIVREFERPVSP